MATFWRLSLNPKRANIMLYRIVNHLVAISPQPYLIPRGVALTTRGHDTRFLLPYSRIQSHQQSFSPSAIRLWNELPTAVEFSPRQSFRHPSYTTCGSIIPSNKTCCSSLHHFQISYVFLCN
jgi:hypothetical protein